MRRAIVTSVLSLSALLLASCVESDSSSERIAQLEHQRQIMQIEIEAQRQKTKLEIERMKEAQRLDAQLEKSRQDEARQRQNQEQSSARARLINAIRGLNVYTRNSLLDDYGKVLVISNPNAYSIDFNMKCTAVNGYTKTLFISVGARDSTEVGFLEGWNGNFQSGEKVEFMIGNETVATWNIR